MGNWTYDSLNTEEYLCLVPGSVLSAFVYLIHWGSTNDTLWTDSARVDGKAALSSVLDIMPLSVLIEEIRNARGLNERGAALPPELRNSSIDWYTYGDIIKAIEDARGELPAGWLQTPKLATLADILQSQTGIQGEDGDNLFDTIFDLIDAIDDTASIIDSVSGVVGKVKEITLDTAINGTNAGINLLILYFVALIYTLLGLGRNNYNTIGGNTIYNRIDAIHNSIVPPEESTLPPIQVQLGSTDLQGSLSLQLFQLRRLISAADSSTPLLNRWVVMERKLEQIDERLFANPAFQSGNIANIVSRLETSGFDTTGLATEDTLQGIALGVGNIVGGRYQQPIVSLDATQYAAILGITPSIDTTGLATEQTLADIRLGVIDIVGGTWGKPEITLNAVQYIEFLEAIRAIDTTGLATEQTLLDYVSTFIDTMGNFFPGFGLISDALNAGGGLYGLAENIRDYINPAGTGWDTIPILIANAGINIENANRAVQDTITSTLDGWQNIVESQVDRINEQIEKADQINANALRDIENLIAGVPNGLTDISNSVGLTAQELVNATLPIRLDTITTELRNIDASVQGSGGGGGGGSTDIQQLGELREIRIGVDELRSRLAAAINGTAPIYVIPE